MPDEFWWALVRVFSITFCGLILLNVVVQVLFFYVFGIEPYWVTHEPWWIS